MEGNPSVVLALAPVLGNTGAFTTHGIVGTWTSSCIYFP